MRRLEYQLMRKILSNLEPLPQRAWLRRRPVVWPLGELGERGSSEETSDGGTNDDGADWSKPDSVAD